MNRVKFITEIEFKEWSSISRNTDSQLIINSIVDAADCYISDILTEDLYNDVCDKYVSGTYSAAYETLIIDYIKPAVAARAAVLCVSDTTTQMTTKGPQVRSSEYSESPDDTKINMKLNRYRITAEKRENRLFKFLKDNKDSYPLYDDCESRNTETRGGFWII